MQSKTINIAIAIILIVALGLAVYGNSLNNQFIWDDYFLIKDNPQVKNWTYLPQIFTQDVGQAVGVRYGFYRPLATLTYLLNYSFFGLNLTAFHLTNIILHILVALAIFWLANILFKKYLFSLLTGLLFVSHPVHTEAVTYISGRSDLLAALFLLLCFILYIKHLSSGKTYQYILMLLSYALALLSRENSLILAPLLALYHYAFKVKFKNKPLFSLLTLSLIYLILRVTLLQSSLPVVDLKLQSWLSRVPGFFAAIFGYFKIMILPFNLHMEYGNKIFTSLDIQVVAGLLLSLLALIYVFIKRSSTVTTFAILWFFIALAAVSNIYPVGAYMAEHWLYFPSVGFFLVLAYTLNLLFEKKTIRLIGVTLAAVLALFYSYLTLKQNECWREPVSFYQRTLKFAYEPAKIYFNLGNTYYNLDKKKEAIASYKKSIEADPVYDKAYVNLGNIYEDSSRHKDAVSAYKKAIEINPKFAIAYYNLGCAYANSGRYEEAAAEFKNAIKADANYSPAYYSLSLLYFFKKDHNLAVSYYNRSAQLGYRANPEFLKLLQSRNQ